MERRHQDHRKRDRGVQGEVTEEEDSGCMPHVRPRTDVNMSSRRAGGRCCKHLAGAIRLPLPPFTLPPFTDHDVMLVPYIPIHLSGT
jgi:hypothetical protein